MSKFKIGDVVTMSPSGDATFPTSPANPKNIDGTIIRLYSEDMDEAWYEEYGIDEDWQYQVEWSNGEENVYRETDLILSGVYVNE